MWLPEIYALLGERRCPFRTLHCPQRHSPLPQLVLFLYGEVIRVVKLVHGGSIRLADPITLIYFKEMCLAML